MTYAEAVRYLLSLSDFERSGRFKGRPDVAPVLKLLAALGNPHDGRVTVHAAGSKGKGSVCAMVESVLRTAGFRTGLYTSPHLFEYTERIKLNGRDVTPPEFARLVDTVRDGVDSENLDEGRSLVTFDLLTAMAFVAFRESAVDVQVIEVGLGGRVDSTNVFETKEVAVIAPVSLEHTAILGDSIEEIAAEKAGIIIPGCTVVLAPQGHSGAAEVVGRYAEDANATVLDVEQTYRCVVLRSDWRGQVMRIEGGGRAMEVLLPLVGRFQADNATTAVAVVDALRARGLAVSDGQIGAGLAAVKWPGRAQVLRERPLVVADGAHNTDSALRLVETLHDMGADGATFIVGCLADKDIGALARVVAPAARRVVATRADHPRSMDPARVGDEFRALGVPAEDVDSVEKAIGMAMAATDESGVICLAGSLFVAAEAIRYFDGRSADE